MKTEFIKINEKKHLIKIYYEKRNNSRVSIGKAGINIRLPLNLNKEEQLKQILKFKAWAQKKLEENPDKFKEKIKEYNDGDVLKVGEEEYKLKINFKDKHSSSARIVGNEINLVISSNLKGIIQNKYISSLLSKCVASKRLPLLKNKLEELNKQHFNKKINKIFFKNNKSNWGSCSSIGNINISTRLLFAPDDVLEYVCIHELAHLKERNHSESFWNLVREVMPNYKEKEKWLKENREKCVF